MDEILPRRWRRSAGVGVAVAVVIGAACYPYEITSASQTDVVATAHDDTKDFGAVQTYVLLDSVVHVVTDSANFIEPGREFDNDILDRVEENLIALGWVGVRYKEGDPVPPVAPDVALLVAATASRTTNIYYNWWPWYGWYPGWGWGCVTCWPGYGYPTVVQYESGTLTLNMVEPGAAPADTVSVVWVAALRGVLSGSASSSASRITQGIDKAFEQSPYLNGN